MHFLSVPGNDYVLLIGRFCLAAVFAISALSKFRPWRDPRAEALSGAYALRAVRAGRSVGNL
jgi:uncharacterized membrane protein YphA (DoxX/SURF4 family)